MQRIVKSAASCVAAVSIVAGGFLATAPTAEAASSCSAWRVLVDDRGWLPDSHAAKGRCSSIGANRKARVSLDRIADFDYHTIWFTRTNYTYQTSASTLTRGAYYTVRAV